MEAMLQVFALSETACFDSSPDFDCDGATTIYVGEWDHLDAYLRHNLDPRHRIERFLSRMLNAMPIRILCANPTSDDVLEHPSFIPFFADFFRYIFAGADHDSALLHPRDGCSQCASSDLEIHVVPADCL